MSPHHNYKKNKDTVKRYHLNHFFRITNQNLKYLRRQTS